MRLVVFRRKKQFVKALKMLGVEYLETKIFTSGRCGTSKIEQLIGWAKCVMWKVNE